MLERLRYGNRKPSQLSPPEDSKPEVLPHSPIPAWSQGPQNAHYSSGGNRIRALDINSSRTHVVLAGNKILRTLRIDNDNTCVEEYDIRDAASRTQDITAAQRDTFEIEDVAWSRDAYRDYIATAARNGKILLYNINRPDVQIGRLHDHLQQVHKVDFSPIEGGCLLSASQDCTVRLWDLRKSQGNSMVCSSHDTFYGRSDSVRHAKWSPTSTWHFAFCTDSGGVQMWDIRYNNSPLLKFAAHYQTCNSIDWHPDGKHLVSAGRDQDINVWNMVTEGFKIRPVFTFKAPYAIQNVRWRPACYTQDYQDQTFKQCTHLATAYRNYPVIHVWDLRRPLLPFREIHHRKNNGTTDMLWRTKDLIWSVGAEGEFSQVDVPNATKTVDRRVMSTVSIAPDGESSIYIKKRPGRNESDDSGIPRVRRSDVELDVQDKLPFGRSPGGDSFEDNFLTPALLAGRHHSRTPSVRSSKSYGTTPPSSDELTRSMTIDFDLAMSFYSTFEGGQVTKHGSMPGTTSSLETAYLAQKYKLPMIDLDVDVNYFLNLPAMFEQNAEYAQRASRYRDAQTWRVFSLQLEQDLRLRASHNRRRRQEMRKAQRNSLYSAARSRATSLAVPPSRNSVLSSPNIRPIQDREGFNSHDDSTSSRSISPTLSKKPIRRPLSRLNSSSTINSKNVLDASSNITTPLVKPVENKPNDLVGQEAVQQIQSRASIINMRSNELLPPSALTGTDTVREVEEPDERLHLPEAGTSPGERGELWQPSGHRPFSLDDALLEDHSYNTRPRRRNSAESFEMFSSSTDSQPTLSQSTSSNSRVGEYDRESRHSRSHGPDITGFDDRIESRPVTRQGHDSHNRLHAQGDPGSAAQQFRNRSLRSGITKDSHAASTVNLPLRGLTDEPELARSLSDTFTTQLKSVNAQKQQQHHRQEDEVRIIRIAVPSPSPKKTPFVEERQAPSNVMSTDTRNDDSFIVEDFLSLPEKADEAKRGFTNASEMLQRLLVWYIDRGDAQTAATLLLAAAPLLAPFGTQSATAASHEDELIDAVYVDVFGSQNLAFSSEDADDIIRDHHRPFDVLNISPICAESIVSSYHEQLLTLNLLNPATYLRRLAFPAFPSVYEQGLKDTELGLLCKACNNPINNSWDKLCCESCDAYQAACSICWSRESPYELPGGKKKKDKMPHTASTNSTTAHVLHKDTNDDTPPNASGYTSGYASTSHLISQDLYGGNNETQRKAPATGLTSTAHSRRTLYSTCPLCNHSVHAACSTHWYLDPASGGACPEEGCTCACVRGRYREERLEEMEKEERRILAERAEKEELRREGMNAVREASELGRVKLGHRAGQSVQGATSEVARLRGASKKVRVVEPGASAEI